MQFLLEQHLSYRWKDVHHVRGFQISKEKSIKSSSFTIQDENPQNPNIRQNETLKSLLVKRHFQRFSLRGMFQPKKSPNKMKWFCWIFVTGPRSNQSKSSPTFMTPSHELEIFVFEKVGKCLANVSHFWTTHDRLL